MEDVQAAIALGAAQAVKARPDYDRKGKLRLRAARMDREIRWFLIAFSVVSLAALAALGIDWVKMISRVPDTMVIMGKLAMLSFSRFDLALTPFWSRSPSRYWPRSIASYWG